LQIQFIVREWNFEGKTDHTLFGVRESKKTSVCEHSHGKNKQQGWTARA